jgi:co-chaperonin GroES (HSP10)
MKVKPLQDRVIVKRIEEERQLKVVLLSRIQPRKSPLREKW